MIIFHFKPFSFTTSCWKFTHDNNYVKKKIHICKCCQCYGHIKTHAQMNMATSIHTYTHIYRERESEQREIQECLGFTATHTTWIWPASTHTWECLGFRSTHTSRSVIVMATRQGLKLNMKQTISKIPKEYEKKNSFLEDFRKLHGFLHSKFQPNHSRFHYPRIPQQLSPEKKCSQTQSGPPLSND